MEDIKKTANRYLVQALLLIQALMLIGYVVSDFAELQLVKPLCVSYLFVTVVACSTSLIWRHIAQHQPDMLTTFYMATSGFRMLLALFTMLGVYIVVGREQMLPYIAVFMVFYLATIGHHSYFFARFNNKQ